MSEWDWPNSQIVAVVDGDTVMATLTRDMGFGIKSLIPVRLRLNRINAPKGTTVKGKATTARVQGLIAGQTLHLTTIKAYKFGNDGDASREEDGEWMSEITLPDGQNLSDLLVHEGLAVYWDGEGPRPSDV